MNQERTAERADAAFVVHVSWAAARTAGMAAHVRPELVLADSGLPCDTFNFICRARLTSAEGESIARSAVAHFAHRDRPFSWWLGPADRPATLGSLLERIGLARAESELAMAVSLHRLPRSAPIVQGLEVRRATTPAALAEMARLLAANWTPPDQDVETFYRRAAAALLSVESPQRFYVGYLDGEPVATAEATLHAGAVALFNIGTSAAVRGRGIGSMMTWQPLHEAHAAGCDLGVLQAAEAGVGVYRRLGFEAFGEVTEYKP